MRPYFTYSLAAIVVAMATACSAKKSVNLTDAPASPAAPANPSIVGGTETQGATRYCTSPLALSGANLSDKLSRLSKYMFRPVAALEGDVTYCLAITGYGTNVDADIRIEYEDSLAVRGYEMHDPANVYYGNYVQNANGTSLELIFIDDAGFLQVKGSPYGMDKVYLKFRFYNFPSREQFVNQQITEFANKCKNGTYTVAQCLGYNWSTGYWWNTKSSTQTELDLARSLINNSGIDLGTAGPSITEITSGN
jgi:hypothetical protein